jgi:hypothetical protein
MCVLPRTDGRDDTCCFLRLLVKSDDLCFLTSDAAAGTATHRSQVRRSRMVGATAVGENGDRSAMVVW